jgi:hypothetical protein
MPMSHSSRAHSAAKKMTQRGAAPRGRWSLIPASLHAPLNQAMGVVAGTRHEAEAQRFIDYVTGKEGRAILARYGFNPPESESGDELVRSHTITASDTGGDTCYFGGWTAAGICSGTSRVPGKNQVLETVINLPLVLPPSVVGYYLLLLRRPQQSDDLLAGGGR